MKAVRVPSQPESVGGVQLQYQVVPNPLGFHPEAYQTFQRMTDAEKRKLLKYDGRRLKKYKYVPTSYFY